MTAVSEGMVDESANRRRILRRATLVTGGFALATVAVAVLGSALIAWFLSVTGLPFRATWLVLSIFVLLVPLLGIAVGSIRERRRSDGGSARE